MSVQIKQVEYAKEVDDVLVAIVHIVSEIKAGKSIVDLGASALPKLIDAVGGVDQVSEEVILHRKVALQTVGYRTGELADAILG